MTARKQLLPAVKTPEKTLNSAGHSDDRESMVFEMLKKVTLIPEECTRSEAFKHFGIDPSKVKPAGFGLEMGSIDEFVISEDYSIYFAFPMYGVKDAASEEVMRLKLLNVTIERRVKNNGAYEWQRMYPFWDRGIVFHSDPGDR